MLTIRQKIALELNRQLIMQMQEEHPLRQLFWESTLRCNLKCRHCGSDCKISSLHPDMPFNDFRKVLERIKEKYDSHNIMVIVSGGEPLVREDILKCGREIFNLEFPWGMVSNGRLMSPRMIDIPVLLHQILDFLHHKSPPVFSSIPQIFPIRNQIIKKPLTYLDGRCILYLDNLCMEVFPMKIEKSLLSGSTPMLVLSLLADGDKYGYEMVTELARRSDDTFQLKEGTLYPLLHSMEKEKLVRSYVKESGGRQRKYYALTEYGKERLSYKEKEWRLFSEKVNAVLHPMGV